MLGWCGRASSAKLTWTIYFTDTTYSSQQVIERKQKRHTTHSNKEGILLRCVTFRGATHLREQGAGGESKGPAAQITVLQAAGGGREVEAIVAWAGWFRVCSLHLNPYAAPADGQEVAGTVTKAWVVWSLLGCQWLEGRGEVSMLAVEV